MSGRTLVRWLQGLRCCESANALVETALTLPIFIALLLGAVELGDLAYKANEITNAARSAAQYAATVGGAYTDCDGKVPDSSAHDCKSPHGIYITAQKDAPLVTKSCTSFSVKASTTCICSDNSACSFSATSAGYPCSARPVIMVSVHTSAQCSPAASIPNLFPIGSAFTLNGYSQQEVTN
jgi:Flp pilus assembly protein TadG